MTMANDASAALGVPEIAGTMVNPKGLTKKVTASVAGSVAGGALGNFAARRVMGDSYAGAPDVPNFGRVGYLAVTSEEIALVKTNTGAFKMKVSDEVLARVPRSEIASVDWDGGFMLSHLKIAFKNGVLWEFDIPKAGKKGAEAFVRVLDPSQA
jgi:hypothetical protein